MHERIDAGKPQQNATHERMHLTMLVDRNVPVANSILLEQKRLHAWQHEFNTERPHEALDFDTPESRYKVSSRAMPRRLPPLEYDATMRVRKVDSCGKLYWKGRDVFATEALKGQLLGFEPTDKDGIWTIWLGKMRLGSFNEKHLKIIWATTAKPGKTD